MNKHRSLSIANNPNWRRVCLLLGGIFVVFVVLDFFFPEVLEISSGLKLLSIVILCLAQYLLGQSGSSYWKAAAGVTVFTDYLLLFTRHYGWGIFFFIFVHYLRYLERMTRVNNDHPYRLAFFAMGLYLLLQVFLSQVLALSITYGVFLLLNTVDAIRSGDEKLILAYVLFCACDLSVAIANIADPMTIATIFRKLIWIFYLPSQILLADVIIKPSKIEN